MPILHERGFLHHCDLYCPLKLCIWVERPLKFIFTCLFNAKVADFLGDLRCGHNVKKTCVRINIEIRRKWVDWKDFYFETRRQMWGKTSRVHSGCPLPSLVLMMATKDLNWYLCGGYSVDDALRIEMKAYTIIRILKEADSRIVSIFYHIEVFKALWFPSKGQYLRSCNYNL